MWENRTSFIFKLSLASFCPLELRCEAAEFRKIQRRPGFFNRRSEIWSGRSRSTLTTAAPSCEFRVWKPWSSKQLKNSMNQRKSLITNYLNNYFNFHVCLSIRLSVRSFVCPVPSAQKLTSIPASVSQNVTNKSCLVRVKSEKYASLVTLRPQ